MLPPPPCSPLFPYTTLFRSLHVLGEVLMKATFPGRFVDSLGQCGDLFAFGQIFEPVNEVRDFAFTERPNVGSKRITQPQVILIRERRDTTLRDEGFNIPLARGQVLNVVLVTRLWLASVR